ncbi:MAG: MmgE/PrpD family protein, partial [Proteobacteria bacterium]|nr:MmgE/PrpD family protein [Burkholderiales bacterium]
MASPYPTTVTADAARFIEALTLADIPREAARIGRRCILDGLSVMIAGLGEETCTLLADEAQAQGGRKDALLFGRGRTRVPAPSAARVLG